MNQPFSIRLASAEVMREAWNSQGSDAIQGFTHYERSVSSRVPSVNI